MEASTAFAFVTEDIIGACTFSSIVDAFTKLRSVWLSAVRDQVSGRLKGGL